MAKNRSIEQKILKMKRQYRFARFSGATTHLANTRNVDVLVQEGEDKVTVKSVEVYVGPASFSKQVMSTGRGPDTERMQTYYQRLHTFDQMIPKTVSIPKGRPASLSLDKLMVEYSKVLDQSKNMFISLVNNPTGKLDLFYAPGQWFFVDVDYKEKTFKRSRIYGTKEYALKMLKYKTITWVEVISSRKVEPA